MAKRPEKYDANLPRNLTYRKHRKIYAWRNPVTGKEISLGRISRRDAVAQAIEANLYIEQTSHPSILLDKLLIKQTTSFSSWVERYLAIIQRRGHKPITNQIRKGQIATLEKHFGQLELEAITTRDIAIFLDSYVAEGKNNMAATLRSVLQDMFREAMTEGIIERNPVEPTRVTRLKVSRQRMSLSLFLEIRDAAGERETWLQNIMNLALITGQRREDLTRMQFADIREDRLYITQGKSGHRLALPLSLELVTVPLNLKSVIEQCQKGNASSHLIFSSETRGGRMPGPLTPNTITHTFAEVRDSVNGNSGESPPTFHEIRSLAGRLYEKERGAGFAQRVLGHKNLRMTEKYLDMRGMEYVLV